MQNRMKLHALSQEVMEEVLEKAIVGRLATIDPEGYPYVVPGHFVFWQAKVYDHGLPLGQKLAGIARDPKVGFEVDEMVGLLDQDVTSPCDVNTSYRSVIAKGEAILVGDPELKQAVLKRIVAKYTPHLTHLEMPPAMVRGTAVLEITLRGLTGKRYP